MTLRDDRTKVLCPCRKCRLENKGECSSRTRRRHLEAEAPSSRLAASSKRKQDELVSSDEETDLSETDSVSAHEDIIQEPDQEALCKDLVSVCAQQGIQWNAITAMAGIFMKHCLGKQIVQALPKSAFGIKSKAKVGKQFRWCACALTTVRSMRRSRLVPNVLHSRRL